MKSLPISRMELDILDIDKELRNLFLSPPDSEARLPDLIEFALDQEQKMAVLYDDLYAERGNSWKSVGIEDRSIAGVERLKGIFDEGKEHIQVLKELLAETQVRDRAE